MLELNKIYNEDCLETMKRMPDNSIDLILTDPPYGYLKHKLDLQVDFIKISNEWKRILKDDGIIAMFGRGVQLYKWASYLADIGFKFLEEIIWNKRQPSSPMLNLMRIHELILVFTSQNGQIRKRRIGYENEKDNKIISNDLKRLISSLKSKNKDELIEFLNTNTIKYKDKIKTKFDLFYKQSIKSYDQGVAIANKIINGFVEKSIIEQYPEHYKYSHPTQKPIKLLTRLLNITSDNGAIVYDPFIGSGSTAIACLENNRNYIGSEIDEEYFNIAEKRINDFTKQLNLNFID